MSLKHLFNSDDDIRIEKNKNGEDVYVFDPYNPLNREIGEADVRQILATYGINLPIRNINTKN